MARQRPLLEKYFLLAKRCGIVSRDELAFITQVEPQTIWRWSKNHYYNVRGSNETKIQQAMVILATLYKDKELPFKGAKGVPDKYYKPDRLKLMAARNKKLFKSRVLRPIAK